MITHSGKGREFKCDDCGKTEIKWGKDFAHSFQQFKKEGWMFCGGGFLKYCPGCVGLGKKKPQEKSPGAV